MYCSGCGQPVDPRQQVCGHCGKPLPLLRVGSDNRVHRHVRTAGTLWIAYAALQLLQWLIALPFLSGVMGGWAHRWGPYGALGWQPHFAWWIPLVTAILIGRAILYVVTGYGLMRQERWGRMLALVTAFLTLLKFPFGTALAIFTLWLLLPAASALEYDSMVPTYPAGPVV